MNFSLPRRYILATRNNNYGSVQQSHATKAVIGSKVVDTQFHFDVMQ